jgi:hypothetical protein
MCFVDNDRAGSCEDQNESADEFCEPFSHGLVAPQLPSQKELILA